MAEIPYTSKTVQYMHKFGVQKNTSPNNLETPEWIKPINLRVPPTPFLVRNFPSKTMVSCFVVCNPASIMVFWSNSSEVFPAKVLFGRLFAWWSYPKSPIDRGEFVFIPSSLALFQAKEVVVLKLYHFYDHPAALHHFFGQFYTKNAIYIVRNLPKMGNWIT